MLQQSNGYVTFPVVLNPNPNATTPVQLTDAIKANKEWLETLIHQSGAILFRGFPVSTAIDFNEVVEASCYDDFSYVAGGLGTRNNVFGRVYTANESPPEQKIVFHHEISHVCCSIYLIYSDQFLTYICVTIWDNSMKM